MAYGEKMLYVSALENIIKEPDSERRELYLDELINISSKSGKTRETEILEGFKTNKNGMRDYALKNGNAYIFREMFATAYENGLEKNVKETMCIRMFGDFMVANDVIILYNGNKQTVKIPSSFEGVQIRRIGVGAFYKNNAVEDVSISDGIKEIGNKAFSKCPYLKTLAIASGIEKIQPNAFEGSKALWSIRLCKEISGEMYEDIIENGIKLTDGRYIIDPMILGGEFTRQIKEYMPVPMAGRFHVHKKMGYLFEVPPRTVDVKKVPIPLVFQQYADMYKVTPNEFRNENAAFLHRIRVDDMRFSFEHDEEADDFALCNKDTYDNAGMVFVEDFIEAEDGTIKALLEIKAGTYFFQRGLPVRYGMGVYYLYFREELSTDDNRPYVRRLGPTRVFSKIGPISMADYRSMGIVSRFSLLSEMM